MEEYTASEILDIAMEIGMNLLRSGAEIKRVEDTIIYISKAYGATEVDVFAIPTLIVGTIKVNNETYTSKVKRNHAVTTDLYRLEKYNTLSRYICENKPSLSEVFEKVKEIQEKKDYNIFILILGAIFSAAGFSIFFGGSIKDALAASIVAIMMMVFMKTQKQTFNSMMYTLIVSVIGGFGSLLMCWMNIGEHLNYVMIGAIMIVIPGLAIGTSIRDIMTDDVLSGSMRLFQVLVTSIAISGGFSIWTKVYGQPLGYITTPVWWIVLIASAIGTLGYSIVFNNKYKQLPIVTVCGVLTALAYVIFKNLINNEFFSIVLGSILATLLSEILARVIKAPATVFLLPGIIPLVPGGKLYYTMYYLINGKTNAFVTNLVDTILASLAIAVGIVVISVSVQIVMTIYKKWQNKRKNLENVE